MDKVKNALTRKFGPLPAWGWFLLAFAGIYFYRKWSANNAASTATTSSTTTVPSWTDTGSGWWQGSGSTGGGSSGSASPTDSSIADALNGLNTTLGQLGLGGNTPTPTTPATPNSPPDTSPGNAAIQASNQLKVGTKLANGGIVAPYGKIKPKAPPGFHSVGRGSGTWYFEPNKKPVTPKNTTSANGGSGRPRSNAPTKPGARPSTNKPKTTKPAASHPPPKPKVTTPARPKTTQQKTVKAPSRPKATQKK